MRDEFRVGCLAKLMPIGGLLATVKWVVGPGWAGGDGRYDEIPDQVWDDDSCREVSNQAWDDGAGPERHSRESWNLPQLCAVLGKIPDQVWDDDSSGCPGRVWNDSNLNPPG